MIVRCIRAVVVLTCLTTSVYAARANKSQPTLRDQEQAACYGDATRLCNEFVPDEEKIEACMRAKMSQISAGCRKFFH